MQPLISFIGMVGAGGGGVAVEWAGYCAFSCAARNVETRVCNGQTLNDLERVGIRSKT